MNIAIVTTRHWAGDPRLNRHATYLRAGGHSVEIFSAADRGRLSSLLSAARHVLSSDTDVVILPDPDFFGIGAFLARIRGARPVIDIHEDYSKTARNRTWIPDILRPVVSIMAWSLVAIGRVLAWRVMVAAAHLGKPGETVVLNIPSPEDFRTDGDQDERRLVYVGDITIARGATDMLRALAGLPADYTLMLIGPMTEKVRADIERAAVEMGVSERLEATGRLKHDEAWEMASGAQYGLSLLRETPAYRDAVATKLWEYMASGMIPIVSDLPGQSALVSRLDPELACSGPDEVADLIVRLAGDLHRIRDLSSRARAMAEQVWDEARPDLAIQSVLDP